MKGFRRIGLPRTFARAFRIIVTNARQSSLTAHVTKRTMANEPVLMRHCVRMPLWIAACFVLFSFVGWERTAYAGIIVFTDPQSFFQTGRVVSTETFDELLPDTVIGVGSVTLDGITYTSADPLAQWSTNDSFVTPSPPNSLVQGNVIAPAKLTFAAGGHTDAVGFFLLPGSTIPGGNYRFDVATKSGETLTVDSGVVGATIFRGFVPTNIINDGITSISITPLEVSGGKSNFNLDNVSRGVITSPTPPTVTASASPSVLWPPNGSMVPVTVSGTMTASSGLNTSTAAFAVTDEYGQVQPSGSVIVGSNGSYSFVINLQARRHGNDRDGRLYTINVSAQDSVGNTGTATTIVVVPHDQGH